MHRLKNTTMHRSHRPPTSSAIRRPLHNGTRCWGDKVQRLRFWFRPIWYKRSQGGEVHDLLLQQVLLRYQHWLPICCNSASIHTRQWRKRMGVWDFGRDDGNSCCYIAVWNEVLSVQEAPGEPFDYYMEGGSIGLEEEESSSSFWPYLLEWVPQCRSLAYAKVQVNMKDAALEKSEWLWSTVTTQQF